MNMTIRAPPEGEAHLPPAPCSSCASWSDTADLAFPETRGERRGAGSAAFACGTLLSGQAIARFGIAVAVWLNVGLLAATALAARLVPDRHRRLADEIRPQRPSLGDRRFADSSLEGDGFEPSVPQQIRSRFRDSSPVSYDGLTLRDQEPEVRIHLPPGESPLRT